MKKKLIQEIEATASMLPDKWETQYVTITLPGADANLCVVGKSPYDPAKAYEFNQPVFLKVPHAERIKDGVKQFGQGYIATYLRKVLFQ